MKKIILLILLSLIYLTPVYSAGLMQIAIVEFQPGKGVDKSLAANVSDLLHTELLNTGYFTVVEREQLKSVLKEHAFQLSGITDPKNAVKLGKILNAKKLLSGRVMKIGKKYIINARIVDVEKGESEFADKVEATSEDEIVKKTSELAKKLAGRIIGVPYGDDVIIPPAILPDEEREYDVDISLAKEFKKKNLINCVRINQNGNLFAVGFANGDVEIYSIQTLALMKTIKFKIELKSLYFDDDAIYGVGSDKNIKIYELASGKMRNLLTKQRNTINTIAVSSDGKYKVTGSEDWTINIFKKDRFYLNKNDHKSPVNKCQFSSDGKFFISVDSGKIVNVWSSPYFKKLKSLTGHKDRIVSLSISPDSQIFLTGSFDKKIKLWHMKSYKLVGDYTLHTDTVSALTFYNNDLFFSGSFDGTVRLWMVRRFQEVTLDSDYFMLENIEAKCGYIKGLQVSFRNNKLIVVGNKAIKVYNIKIKQEK